MIKSVLKISSLVSFTFLFTNVSQSQSTYSDVYSIFQTKCSGCHNGSTMPDLSGTSSEVFNTIVNQSPTNPAAAAKGDKLIYPGHPERSFLLRKCATTAWDPYYSIEGSEGNSMPKDQAALSDIELERIRQWILFGASQTETAVADSTIQRFYSGMGIAEATPPVAPSASEGFQLKLGKFFLEPGEEIEFFKKQELNLSDSVEVNRIEIFMNSQSHHFIIYKFDEGVAGSFKNGLREPDIQPSGNNTTVVTAAQYPIDIVLPENTAYLWPQNTILDLNYHILNYSQDSVLAADAYANIYTQPKGTAQQEMFSELILYSNYANPAIFNIPNTGAEKTFTDPFYIPGSTDQMNIWMLSSHTHKWGLDYDVYKRNPDGTKGTQIYEGFYDRDYNFNQGYYDWAHPAIRVFEPFETINLSDGLIQEAKFKNTGASTVFFGLTTKDEMMLITVQYTITEDGNIAGISKTEKGSFLNVYPNPAETAFNVSYEVKEKSKVSITISNLLGEKVLNVYENIQEPGKHNQVINTKEAGLLPGIYLVNFSSGDYSSVERLVIGY